MCIRDRDIGHGVDRRTASSALVVERAPGRDVCAALRRYGAAAQTIGGLEREFAVRGLAGHMMRHLGAAVEDEANVVRVAVLGADGDKPQPLFRELSIFLVAGVKIS